MVELKAIILFALSLFSLLPRSQGSEVQKILDASKHAEDASTILPGVGFDLTASYGIAAVSYPNGTKSAIAKIDGSSQYHEMFSRLSLASSAHPAPPYSDTDEMYRDQPRQAKRQARKASGLPASEDVAVLSAMLDSLREAVEGHLGHRIQAAAATVPHLIALYLEDLHDAFEYVGLQSLDMPVRYGLLRETSAASAGHGLGLCTNYTDRDACKAEQQDMPDDVVMAVLYTHSALITSLAVTKSPYYLWEPHYRRIEDFRLGTDSRYDNPNEEYYWERLRDRLREIIVANQYSIKPTKVLLLGESARDDNFMRILTEALESVMEKVPEMYQENAESIAALGAAELALRAPWDPYKSMADGDSWAAFRAVNEQRDRSIK